MAGRLEREPGGILGLCRLLTEYGEAIEYDLLVAGLRIDDLGTERLSWRHLLVMVEQSPRGSALARAVHGEAATWGPLEYLMAIAVDAIQWGNWQRGGGKGPKPNPMPRPVKTDDRTVKTFGSAPLPIDELDAWLKAKEVA